jgi:hypothetical protein
MKQITLLFQAAILVFVLVSQPLVQAQGLSDGKGFGLYSLGLNFGSYAPSMDYYDRTPWDFSPSLMVQAEADINVVSFLRLRVGAGYGSTSSTVFRGEPFGSNEEFSYSFIPVSVSVLPHVQIGMVDVYAGGGIDLMNIGARYQSRSYDTKVSGSTMLPHALLGAQIGIAPRTMLSLQGRYLIGEFDQQLRGSEGSQEFTETIKMDGLHFSVGVRFRM